MLNTEIIIFWGVTPMKHMLKPCNYANFEFQYSHQDEKLANTISFFYYIIHRPCLIFTNVALKLHNCGRLTEITAVKGNDPLWHFL